MLTRAQLDARAGCVTASFLPWLMAGNEDKILAKWRELVGDPHYEEPDYTDDWPVRFGTYIEPFALDWAARRDGYTLSRHGEVVKHPERAWFAATLDAYRASTDTVIDCKTVGFYRKIEDVVAFYTPQMIGQARAAGATSASLLIVHGGSEPVEHPVTWEPDYELAVWCRASAFMDCVNNLIPPVAMPELKAPVKIEQMRPYNMSSSNRWCAEAHAWLTHRAAAAIAKTAEKSLKELVPNDASRAYGAGIAIVRDKAGRMSLKPEKE